MKTTNLLLILITTLLLAGCGDDRVDLDIDNDGLSNVQEIILGLDPENPDTDNDGVPDDIEIGNPDNPTDTDSDGTIDALDEDDDNDGISTKDELPIENDTDGDGIVDYLDFALQVQITSIPPSIYNTNTFNISGTGSPEQNITLVIDSVTYTTTTDTNGSWNINLTTPLSDGNHTVTATITDITGPTNTETVTTTVLIDTTPPVAPATPDLLDASDTGTSNTDNITNDNTGDFNLSCSPNGDTITLYLNGSADSNSTCTAGVATFTNIPLVEGDNNITATQTDIAGNESPQSPVLVVSLDTTDPIAPTTTTINDGGDNILNATEIAGVVTATVVLPAGLVAGDILNFDSNNDGTYDINRTLSAADITANEVNLTISSIPTDGTLTVVSAITDIAGNTGPTSNDSSTTDSTPPVAPATPDLLDVNDTGSLNTDNITNHSAGDFNLSCSPNGDTVTLYLNTLADSNSTCTAGVATFTAIPLVEGDNNITATQTDIAGNQSPQSPVLVVSLDTTDPIATTS
ncbi:MAG: Unknown protein, partial [uncultured Campylobacterales bacterium]